MAKVAPTTEPASAEPSNLAPQSDAEKPDPALALSGNTIANTAASFSQALSSPLEVLEAAERQAVLGSSLPATQAPAVPGSEPPSTSTPTPTAKPQPISSQDNPPSIAMNATDSQSASPAGIKSTADVNAESKAVTEALAQAEAGTGKNELKADAAPSTEQISSDTAQNSSEAAPNAEPMTEPAAGPSAAASPPDVAASVPVASVHAASVSAASAPAASVPTSSVPTSSVPASAEAVPSETVEPKETELVPQGAETHDHAPPSRLISISQGASPSGTENATETEATVAIEVSNTDKKRKPDSPADVADETPTKKQKPNPPSQPVTIEPTPNSQSQADTNSQTQTPHSSDVHTTGDPNHGTDSVASPGRPLPRNLPKTVRNRPENARVFIGNLASEYTNTLEIIKIFHRYGNLIEEPVLRRSFGFVQYSSAEEATEAVAKEQGRIIGGMAIDLSIADNREVKRGTHIQNNTPFSHSAPVKTQMRGRGRGEREPDRGRKRRRSLSPASAARKGGVHPPQYGRRRPDPKNGIYLRILCMSPTAKAYARHCENTFRNMTGLTADVLHIVAAGLGEALGKAMRDVIPYVMVVASKDVEDGTCTIRTLEKTGYEKSGRGNGVIPLREAVEVCLIERGVIAPQGMNQMAAMPAPPPGVQSGGQWGAPGGNMGNMQSGKPAWMAGPRPPPNGNPNMAPSGPVPPPMMGGMPAAGGYPPYQTGPPSSQHRPDQNYSRSTPPVQSGYDGYNYNSNPHNQGQSNTNMPGGGRDRYGGEYDPAAVTPHRGGGNEYNNNWNRGSQPVNRNDTYSNDRRAPAITRDRNGFHTVPSTSVYQSGTVPTSESQTTGMYGGVPGSGYDSRQGGYPQTSYPPYGGAAEVGMSQGMAGGQNMPHGMNSTSMHHGNNGAGLTHGNPSNMRHGAEVGMSTGLGSEQYGGGYNGGGYNNGGYNNHMMGGRSNLAMGQSSDGYGPAVDRGMDRNAGGNSYMGRPDHGAASMGMNSSRHGNDRSAGGQNGGPAGPPGTVDIGKLTNLISAFQQKHAAVQAQTQNQNRGVQNQSGRQQHMGYATQQNPPPPPPPPQPYNPQHSGGQQYPPQQMGGQYNSHQQGYPYGAPAHGAPAHGGPPQGAPAHGGPPQGAPMPGVGRQQHGYYR